MFSFVVTNIRIFFFFKCARKDHTASSWSVPTPLCHSLPLGTGMSVSGTTFGWLHDVLFIHMHGVVIL